MTRSIKELAPKPSDAIKAMIQGLRTLPSETFKIRMSTFGQKDLEKKICFGCAATCTVHLLGEKPPSLEHILLEEHAEYLGFDREESNLFEDAIDEFRAGRPKALFEFYEEGLLKIPTYKLTELTFVDWYLSTNNWEDEISKIEEYVEKLVVLGL